MAPAEKRKPSLDLSQQDFKRQDQGINPFDLILDQDGDLKLSVTENFTTRTAAIVVNRSILCLSSPVFRAMLGKHSRFSEGQRPETGGIQEIELEEDDLESLVNFLRIIHLRCDEVPRTVTAGQVQHMASLCDKYDSAKSLGMWPATWLQPGRAPWSSYSYASRIRIANILKIDHLLAETSKTVLLACTAEPNGALRTEEDGLLEGTIPQPILGM